MRITGPRGAIPCDTSPPLLASMCRHDRFVVPRATGKHNYNEPSLLPLKARRTIIETISPIAPVRKPMPVKTSSRAVLSPIPKLGAAVDLIEQR